MQLPEKGSPDRRRMLQEVDINTLLKLNYEDLSDMNLEELRLISARLDEQIKDNERELEAHHVSYYGESYTRPKYNRAGYFTDEPYFPYRESEHTEILHRENLEIKKYKELLHSLELKCWAQDTHFKNLMTRYRCAMKDVRTRLEIIDMGLEMQYHRHLIQSITDRIKEPESIQEKLKRKKKPVEIDTLINDNPLYDIAGIRVICAFRDDIDLVEEWLRKQPGITILEGDRRKDHIHKPKASGYQSLHLIVKVPVYLSDEPIDTCVEVQIRTLAMDFWSSLEHDIKYKQDITNEEEVTNRLKKCAKDIAELDEEMIQIRDLARREKQQDL